MSHYWISRLILASGLTAALISPLASALTQDITAKFRPDQSNPTVNEFVNTTPQSGICPGHIPGHCNALGIFTIRTNAFTAEANGPIPANHPSPRQGAMWKVPSEWRAVQVTHTETGQTDTVQMRIAGIGHRWNSRPGVSAWVQPGLPWSSAWRDAPSPCRGINYFAAGTNFVLFFWLVPENAGVCHRVPSTTIDWFNYSNMEYAYGLKTPNPLAMAPGEYTGSISYVLGPGGDFDFGDVMIPNDNVLTFNFTLTVDHHLRVQVPPGGNRVQLEPQGGWQNWLQNGRKPTRLARDQTVSLWSGGPFKMTLECGQPLGNTCSVSNGTHQVPLEVAVSLPAGLYDSAGRPVNRLPLRLDGSGTERFQPRIYIYRQPSTLHFSVLADGVAQMLEHGSGTTYSGTATVVWDSEV